jgi:hypothetical protein
MGATKKMIELAENIAIELNICLPDYDDFDEISKFIDENKDDYFEIMEVIKK